MRTAVAPDRVARWRRRARQLLPFLAACSQQQKATRPNRHAAPANRTGLRRPQGRARSRPLRAQTLRRMASPRLRRPVLLRVHRRRTRAAFSPLGLQVGFRPVDPRRGLNATSQTASSPSASPSPASLPPGSRAVQSAIILAADLAARLPLCSCDAVVLAPPIARTTTFSLARAVPSSAQVPSEWAETGSSRVLDSALPK